MAVGNQANIFLYSIAGGMLIAFIYDAFRIKRKAVRTKTLVIYFEDFIYWIIVALVMFAVIYCSNDGEPRGYIFAGAIIGVIVYALLLSKLIVRSSLAVLRFLYRVFGTVWSIITYPFKIALKILGIPAVFLLGALKKALKYLKRTGKSRLTKTILWRKMMKNILRKI